MTLLQVLLCSRLDDDRVDDIINFGVNDYIINIFSKHKLKFLASDLSKISSSSKPIRLFRSEFDVSFIILDPALTAYVSTVYAPKSGNIKVAFSDCLSVLFVFGLFFFFSYMDSNMI